MAKETDIKNTHEHFDVHSHEGTALQDDPAYTGKWAGDQLEREARSSLKRVENLSTELEDVTEVEYRKLRLERVVLVGVVTDGSMEAGEDSLRELAALAQTAGSTVLDGVLQRRALPDAATYLGSGKHKNLPNSLLQWERIP